MKKKHLPASDTALMPQSTEQAAEITDKLHAEFAQELRLEGISFMGYGILPKFTMLDETLTLEAKAIYAYLCSYTGRGNTLFPGRQRILDDLQVNKDTYYKHYRLLLEQGYVTVQQQRSDSGFFKNVYTMVSCPEKFARSPEKDYLQRSYDTIRLSGLKGAGYGFIPKAVMADQSLSLKAKGVYAYYCSFTGAGESAHPDRDTVLRHLGISAKLLSKYTRELKARNYITVSQRLTDNGRFGVNDVIIVDTPDAAEAETQRRFSRYHEEDDTPCGRFSDTGEGEGISPYSRFSDTRISDAQISDAENSDTNKNSSPNKNNFLNKNNLSISVKEMDRVVEETKKQQTQYDMLGYTPLLKKETAGEKMLQAYVLGEILAENTLPWHVFKKKDTARAAVSLITEDILCGSPAFYRGEEDGQERYEVFCLYRDCLLELLHSKKPQQINGCSVTAREVYEHLLPYIRVTEKGVCFSLPGEDVQENYRAARREREITNPTGYMKSCIYNMLLCGNLPL